MQATYHLKHPSGRWMLSQDSREGLLKQLELSKNWPTGSYPIYLFLTDPGSAEQEDYYCGFAIKNKDGTVKLDQGTLKV